VTLKHAAALAAETGARASGAARAAGRLARHGAEAARGVIGKFGRARWALADQCVVSAANFFTIFLFARNLDAATFGAFMLAYTGLQLMTNLQNALVVQPHNVLAAGLKQPEYGRFTGALALLQMAFCVAAGLVLGIAGWIVSLAYSSAIGHTLVALAIAAVPWMGQEFVRRVLYTRGDSRSAAINDGVTYGLQLFGAFVLVHAAAAWATPASALWVLGLSSTIGLLVGVWQLRHQVSFESRGRGAFAGAWKEAWHFGKWLTAQNVFAWFGAQGHSWVVVAMLGVEQVGLYRAATHLVNVMNPLMQVCFSYLPSRGSLAHQAGGQEGLSKWVKRMQGMLLLAIAPLLLALIAFPGQVLDLAYGDKYAGTNLPLILALMAIGQAILFLKFPFDIGLLALRSTKSIFLAYLIPVLLLLTSGVTLIHFFGILGVPMSGILINVALFATTWLAYKRRLKGT
jgi:O-antigen/teichoic acid export membrane protein